MPHPAASPCLLACESPVAGGRLDRYVQTITTYVNLGAALRRYRTKTSISIEKMYLEIQHCWRSVSFKMDVGYYKVLAIGVGIK